MWDQGMTMRAVGKRGAGTRRHGGLLAVAAAALVVGAVGVWPGAVSTAQGATGAGAQTVFRPQDSSAGQTVCDPNGAGVTCSGTYSGATSYDPTTDSGESGITPTVTVSQVANLTHQVLNVGWTGFTPTYTGENSQAINPNDAFNIMYGVSIVECKGTNPQYDGFYGDPTSGDPLVDCYATYNAGAATSGQANSVWAATSAGSADTSNEPSNGTVSCLGLPAGDACGTGSAQVQIETLEENNFLGCDSDDPCSLVVLPNWGGYDGNQFGLDSSDPTDTEGQLDYSADCYGVANHDYDGIEVDFPLAQGGLGEGTMAAWGDSCAWADRFVIPLDFAPSPSQFCPLNDYQFDSEGSPFLEKAIQQWEPGWCTQGQDAVDFGYNSAVDEYDARADFLNGSASGLSSGTDVALVTDPASADAAAGSTRQYTYAPIANTGIAIAYYVDNYQTGEPITNLVLNARLLAKLLTNSYSYAFDDCSPGQSTQAQTCDPNVAGNPASIFQDPEFYKLNPEYTPADFYSPNTADDDTEPIVVAGDSDMTFELTRWIESDPDARAFLQGQPDPWGMHVNDAYQAYFHQEQSYPVPDFLEVDPGFSQTPTQALNGPAPQWVATMQATWNPVTGQDSVDSGLLGWKSTGISFGVTCETANGECGTTGNPYSQTANPAEYLGQRSLFAVVDTGDSGAYQFPTAQLVNPAGNAVGPTTDAMTAALGAMQTNPDKITQFQNYSATSPNAYPLTEVQYAMVPTCGLPQAKATAISNFLTDVANSQDYGTDVGQLPDFGGYLTLNSAQNAQTVAAAQAVASQTCTSPPADTTVSGQSGVNNGAPAGGNSGISPDDAINPTTAASIPAYVGPSGAGTPSKSATGPATQPVALGTKGADDSDVSGTILVIALIVGALLAIGGPLAYVAGTSGTGTSYINRRRQRGAAQPPATGPGPMRRLFRSGRRGGSSSGQGGVDG
jgi:hypothetical protein